MTTLDMVAEQETRRELPKGWRWVRLGEVCSFLDSRRIPINETERRRRIAGKSQSELFPYYGANGQVGWIDDYLFDEPLILLAEDGGNFGSTDKPIAYAVSGRYWVNNHAHVLKPHQEVDFDYCLHMLRIRPDVGDLVSGSTRAKLNQEVAATISIPLPPLAEQRRIAAILAEQLAAVADARAAAVARLEAAQALPAAYLRAVFESDEARGWERQELRSLCRNDGQYGTSSSATTEPIGIPVLRMGNLQNGRIFWDDLKYIMLPKEEEIKYLLQVGDLIFNRTNSAELVGKTAVFDTRRDAIFASYLIRFQLDHSLVNPFFVSLYINSSQGRAFIHEHMARAIGQVNISASIMHRMPIPVPTLRNQEHIAATLTDQFDAVDQTCITLQSQIDAIDALPAALLRRAFNGEL